MGTPARCPWAVRGRGGSSASLPHGARVRRGCGTLPRMRWGQLPSGRARAPGFMARGVRPRLALLFCAGKKPAAAPPLPETRSDGVTDGGGGLAPTPAPYNRCVAVLSGPWAQKAALKLTWKDVKIQVPFAGVKKGTAEITGGVHEAGAGGGTAGKGSWSCRRRGLLEGGARAAQGTPGTRKVKPLSLMTTR